MKQILIVGALGLGVSAGWAAEGPAAASSAAETGSYSVGYQLGTDLRSLERTGSHPSLEALLRGVSDAMSGAQPQVSPQEMSQALTKLRQGVGDESEEPVASFEQRQTQAFNALNAEQKGVVTLPNGLQYKVLKAGSGRQPQEKDSLTINYKASLPNGVVIDSTYKEGSPATVRLDEVTVPGLKQALGLMQEGAQWQVFVPPALGFPEYSNTLRDRPLIYEVELIRVTPAAAAPAANAQ